MSTANRSVGIALAAVALGMGLAGCGTPGAPQPPSLNLPERVSDLTAVRTGDHVALTWTMPRRNTDKLLLKGDLAVKVCRREGVNSTPCNPIGELKLAPTSTGSFTENLAPQLATGAPRPLSYAVEVDNRGGRSAGLSNSATVLAGRAPDAVAGLSFELRKAGVLLRWNTERKDTAIRLQRTLIRAAQTDANPALTKSSEPQKQNLLMDHDSGEALDKSVTLGSIYEYRAQRLTRAEVDGKTLELAGELSLPIQVDVKDLFPPDAPTGLAAVAVPAEAGNTPAIDLNWQPNTENDLAGYIVYRREESGSWERISGADPVPAPAYHDARVQAGHTYHYAVSAIDQSGHEGKRSEEATESVPQP